MLFMRFRGFLPRFFYKTLKASFESSRQLGELRNRLPGISDRAGKVAWDALPGGGGGNCYAMPNLKRPFSKHLSGTTVPKNIA